MNTAHAPTSIIEDAIAHTEAARHEAPDTTPATEESLELTLAERDARARAEASAAGGVLKKIIETGQRTAGNTIRRVMTEIPVDLITGNKKIGWSFDEHGSIRLSVDGQDSAPYDTDQRIHRHAFGQFATRYNIPVRYLDRLIEGATANAWERDLALTTLNGHAKNVGGRVMLRSYQGQVRGVMSDRYRRLDSRPLLDSLLGALDETGFVVYAGTGSDVKVSIRALKPEIYDIEGDPVVFGLEWTNSDYGAGKHEVRVYVLRTVCLNGMTGESIMSNTHLGKRADADLKLSEATRRKEQDYFSALIREAVIEKAGPVQVEKTIARVRHAAKERIELGESLPVALRRALSGPEQERVRALFESDESVMLPPEPTVHRLSNCLSWMARTASNPERSMDLEKLAGSVAGIG